MRKMILLTLSVLCLAFQPMSAQKNDEGEGVYKYRKAIEIMEEEGNPKEARALLNENIMEYPQYIPSYLALAGLDRAEEKYAAALKTIDKALENNHKKSDISDANLLWWKGIIYDEMGDLQKALCTMQQVVKLARKQDEDNLMDMLETLAQFHYDLEQYAESDKVYREMISLDETEQLPMVGLARNMIARKEYDEALDMLDECRKYDSAYDEIYRFQMKAYEGKKEYKKMIDAMLTLYDKTDNPDYISTQKLKKDRRYSVAVLKERIASENDNALWRLVLASLYEQCYMYSDALLVLSGLVEEYGVDEDLLDERASCYEEMGMTDLALDDINVALEMSQERDKAYFHMRRANILRYDGQYDAAIVDLSMYIDRYPTDAYGYYARGWCKELSGNLSGAMEDYDDGIAVDEDYPYIFLMRGSLHLKNGDEDKAMTDFEAVIAKDTTVEGGSCRHYALYQLGRSEEAVLWMDKIIELDSDDPGKWYDKACLFSRMGREDEAVEALRTSLEKGYRSFPHIEHDDDVDAIRDREDFKNLIEEYKQKLVVEKGQVKHDVKVDEERIVSEVDMKKMYGGTYEVACSVNGLPLKMIFDTGAADVTISSVEASFMLKNGYLTDNDVKGKRNYMTASGDIHEGTILRLKEVKLGDAVLKNIEASVVHSQKAPLLLGQSVLEKFGTITIDNVNSRLLIKQ